MSAEGSSARVLSAPPGCVLTERDRIVPWDVNSHLDTNIVMTAAQINTRLSDFATRVATEDAALRKTGQKLSEIIYVGGDEEGDVVQGKTIGGVAAEIVSCLGAELDGTIFAWKAAVVEQMRSYIETHKNTASWTASFDDSDRCAEEMKPFINIYGDFISGLHAQRRDAWATRALRMIDQCDHISNLQLALTAPNNSEEDSQLYRQTAERRLALIRSSLFLEDHVDVPNDRDSLRRLRSETEEILAMMSRDVSVISEQGAFVQGSILANQLLAGLEDYPEVVKVKMAPLWTEDDSRALELEDLLHNVRIERGKMWGAHHGYIRGCGSLLTIATRIYDTARDQGVESLIGLQAHPAFASDFASGGIVDSTTQRMAELTEERTAASTRLQGAVQSLRDTVAAILDKELGDVGIQRPSYLGRAS